MGEGGVTTRGRGVIVVGVLSKNGCRHGGVLLRVERKEKGGENFIKGISVFLLNNGRCRIHIGKHKIQVPLFYYC